MKTDLNCARRDGMSDQQLFERYQNALSQLLLNSSSARSADFYKNQLFPLLSKEESEQLSEQRSKIMADIYLSISKWHTKN